MFINNNLKYKKGVFSMSYIYLTQGYKTLVDDNLFKGLNKHKWFTVISGRTHNHVYACRKLKGKRRWMSHAVMGVSSEFLKANALVVDYINHNTLDNRRCNLRLATRSQDQMNTIGLKKQVSKRQAPTSSFKGVSWSTRYGLWKASIHVDNKEIYLGRYVDEREAAQMYNRAALFYYKEYATLNPL